MCSPLSELLEEVDGVLRDMLIVDLQKAVLDPLDDGDYIKIVAHLASKLRGKAKAAEKAGLKVALDTLDVDWENLSPAQIDRIVVASGDAFLPVHTKALPELEATLVPAGKRVVVRTRASVKGRYKLKIGADFTSGDKAVTEWAARAQTNYITDEFGRRRIGFSDKARKIVSNGLSKGLDSKAIGKTLSKQLTSSTLNRGQHYWTMVSSVYTSTARTYGNIASFQEGGIERYTFEAVMDEQTTEVCRLMHGKTFTVSSALKLFDKVSALSDPEQIKNTTPFVRERLDANGDKVLSFNSPNGPQTVANIVQPGFGQLDKPGSYSNTMSDSSLQRSGIQYPPLHPLCRSTILPAD